MATRGLQGLECNLRRGLRECAKDAAGVEPARPKRSEYLFPIEVAGLELRDCGMAAIGAAESGAYAIAALGEVQAVSDGTADAVVFHPAHQRLVHTSLVNEVLQQLADRVLRKCRGDRGIKTKATLQPARHIVFTATLPDFEVSSCPNAPISRIEAQHDLAE